MVWGAIVGGIAGIAGQMISSDRERKNRNRQENLSRQKGDLYSKLTKEEKIQAEKNFRQNYADNILSQSLSGIELTSETFQKLNNMQYQEYQKELQNIELQSQFYQLGIENEISVLQSSKPSRIEQGLSFLSSGVGGASMGLGLESKFNINSKKWNISVISKMEITTSDGKKYNVEYCNLNI